MHCGIDSCGTAVSQPFTTLKSLLEWSTPDFHIGASGNQHGQYNDRQAFRQSRQVSNRPKVLVCHDMAGGYLQDRFIQGCTEKTDDAYFFHHWQLVDTFIYFSHSFVTIPPSGWIRAAHKHGVDILGTIITEWEDGAALCKKMLESFSRVDEVTTKLASIASYFGFDGWLINIENKIEPDQVPLLQAFARQLTEKCHAQLQFSSVLWYDSVIHTGELKWQDELNSNNVMFFDVCDGIFLNYCITPEKLRNSKEKALSSARQRDVYVGLDCFGRGTPGGGGFNLRMVLEMLLSEGLSCAFFAPGWVMEHLGPENFQGNNIKFWGLLSDLLNTRPASLPFSTSFCQGKGDKYYLDGKVISDKPWYNLGLQQMQPSFTQSQFQSYTIKHEQIPVIEQSNGAKNGQKDSELALSKANTDGESKKESLSENSATDKILTVDDEDGCAVNAQVPMEQDKNDSGEETDCNSKSEPVVKIEVVSEINQADVNPEFSMDTSCGYNGGGCIRLEALSTPNRPVIFKLMDISKIEDLKQLHVIWKAKQNNHSHQFVLMLSPAAKEASLENAEVIFETNIAKATASFLYKETSLSVCCIPQEHPHEVTKHGTWIKSVHVVRPEIFTLSGASHIPDMTLSVVFVSFDVPSIESVAPTSTDHRSKCIWLGQIQTFTEHRTDQTQQPLLFADLQCLAVKARPELSCTDLEQMVRNPCFKTNQIFCPSLRNSDCQEFKSTAEGVEESDTSSATPAAHCKFSAALTATKSQNNLCEISPTIFTYLDLTSAETETNDSYLMHYLLRWDISNKERVDYFLVYLGKDRSSCTFVGFASSSYFIYSTRNEMKNMSFFIQPILLI